MTGQNEPSAWVSVDERLPRHNETVLVWRHAAFPRLTPSRVDLTTFRLTGDGPRWDADRDNWALPSWLARRITHWMSLPAGPKIESAIGVRERAFDGGSKS
jgi:hypothetical protein